MHVKELLAVSVLSTFLVGCDKTVEYPQLGNMANTPIGELSGHMLHKGLFEGIPNRVTWGAMQVMQACDNHTASDNVCKRTTGQIFSDMTKYQNCEKEGGITQCIQMVNDYIKQ